MSLNTVKKSSCVFMVWMAPRVIHRFVWLNWTVSSCKALRINISLCFSWIPFQHLVLLFTLAVLRSWQDTLHDLLGRDPVSRLEAHILGSVTSNWTVPSMLAVMRFPYHRDDYLHDFFSSPMKREWALLCPFRVDTRILSALNLAGLCWHQVGGSFPYFTWTHYEKIKYLVALELMNSEI